MASGLHGPASYGATAGRVLPNRAPIRSETIRGVIGTALHRAKMATGLSPKAIAEAAGREDPKSARAYLAGDTEMGIEAFVKLAADARFGDQFVNDVLGPLLGRNVCPCDAESAPDIAALPLGISDLLGAVLRAWSDQRLDHQETLALAALLRPLLPHFQAIIADADRIAG